MYSIVQYKNDKNNNSDNELGMLVHHRDGQWEEAVPGSAGLGVLCSAYQRRGVGTACVQDVRGLQ